MAIGKARLTAMIVTHRVDSGPESLTGSEDSCSEGDETTVVLVCRPLWGQVLLHAPPKPPPHSIQSSSCLAQPGPLLHPCSSHSPTEHSWTLTRARPSLAAQTTNSKCLRSESREESQASTLGTCPVHVASCPFH